MLGCMQRLYINKSENTCQSLDIFYCNIQNHTNIVSICSIIKIKVRIYLFLNTVRKLFLFLLKLDCIISIFCTGSVTRSILKL